MKNFRLLIVYIIVLLCLFLTACKDKNTAELPQNEISETAAEIEAFTVVLVLGEAEKINALTTVKLIPGDILHEGETIVTAAQAVVDLRYRDIGIIRISESSECSITEIAEELNSSTNIKLKKGTIAATFGKLKKEKFEVSTQTLVAAVRGTSFVISTEQSSSKVSVAKGTVSVIPLKNESRLEALAVNASSGEKVSLHTDQVKSIQSGVKTFKAEAMSKKELSQTEKTITEIKVESVEQLAPEVKTEISEEVSIETQKAVERLPQRETVQLDRPSQTDTPARTSGRVVAMHIDDENAESKSSMLENTRIELRNTAAPCVNLRKGRTVKFRPLDFSAKHGINVSFLGGLRSLDKNDWIEYKVIVPETATYRITVSAMNPYQTGSLDVVSLNGSKNIAIPVSTWAQHNVLYFVSRSDYVDLLEGEQTIRFRVKDGGDGVIINSIKIKKKFNFSDLFGGKNQEEY